MLYYYAHSGHKIGLDRVRRGTALLKKLKDENIDSLMLVNDFRAGLACRELGLSEYVTIETIQDIDAIASLGDTIIIDSNEDDHGRIVKYCSEFKSVFRFASSSEDSESIISEIVLDRDTNIIDSIYFEKEPKESRVVLFLSDFDYDKTILNNSSFFKSFDMELILGNYFFVKYEDDLAKIFSTLHEPEEYQDIIKSSSCILTASTQSALEAKATGAKVIFLNILQNQIHSLELLSKYGIPIVDGFDKESLSRYLDEDSSSTEDIESFDCSVIKSRL